MQVFLGSASFAVGYLLLYAAFHDGGANALRPWQALSS